MAGETYFGTPAERALIREKGKRFALESIAMQAANGSAAGLAAAAKSSGVAAWQPVAQEHYYEPQGDFGHKYFLELVVGEREQILDVVKFPYVSKIDGDPTPATVLTFTNTHLYEEHEGYRQRTFTLVGRSGFTPADIDNFKRFRNFFEKVQAKKAQNLSAFLRGDDIRLVLNFPFEGESYYCNVVRGLSYARDRSVSTYSYIWTVTLRTSGYVGRKWAVPNNLKKFLDTECSDDSDACHTGRTHPCRVFAEITREDLPVEASPLIDLVDILVPEADLIEEAGGLGNLNSLLLFEDLYTKANVNYAESTLWFRELTLALHDNYLFNFIDIAGWASNLIMESKLAKGMYQQKFISDIVDTATGGMFNYIQRIDGMIEVLAEELKATRLISEEVVTRTTYDQRSLPGPLHDIRGQEPVTVVELGPYDSTVYEVAYRLYGRTELGDTLLRLNPDLADAKTWVGGRRLSPGDTLTVPAIGGLANREGPPLGVDWKVVDYDFVWDPIRQDMVRVEGMECYLQNTAHRISTEYDTNRAFRGTGIKNLSNADNDQAAVVKASEVQQQLLLDPRTLRIVHLDYTDDDAAIEVRVQVELSGGATAGVTFRG